MIVYADQHLLLIHCLRCWDIYGEAVEDIVWFDTDTMIASVRVGEVEREVRIGKFCFHVQLPTAALRLAEALPPTLHDYIEQVEPS